MQENIAYDSTNFATELRQYKAWVCHDADKRPLNPRTGLPASSTNPEDQGTYEEAVAALHRNVGVGLGFVLSDGDPFTVIDLDDPTNPKHGFTQEKIQEIYALQQQIHETFDSYSEVSPSGKGLHIWIKAKVPTGKKRSDKCVEMYSTGRYMTVTLQTHNKKAIAEAHNLANTLWADMGGSQTMPTQVVSQPEMHTDEQIISKCASENTDFQQLWAGDISGHNNDGSSADQALMNLIAHHTDNKEQCIRVFRKSVLAQRVKNGKVKSTRNDYMKRTVDKAFDQKGPMLSSESITAFNRSFQIQNVPFPSYAQTPTKRKVEVISMDNIQPEKITWLLQDWLALGKFSLIAGGPGIGKSQMTLAFAATVSNGGVWPDGTRAKQGRVVVWSGEDGVADTIAPRLWAAGARLDQIYTISATTDDKGNKLPFSPTKDIPLLIETIELLGDVVLVIIDPIVSVIEKDMNQTNVVRNSLQPLVDMGSKLGFCTLGITHFRKGSEGQEPLDRILGSGAFGALPRTVLVAAKDKFSERRVLALAKGNLGNDTSGYEYTIESATIRNDIPTSKFVWGCALTGSARDILASVEVPAEAEQPSTKIEEAKRFLETHLNNGVEVTAIELVNKAGVFGISSRTLQRAKTELGIVDYKSFGGPSMWRFPLKFDNNINSTAPRGT